mmetsp:Transcript_82021/g.219489  ORF Transcript_82021/g.219489 Transcript_82021/m.219489 type:complete len:330 (-) Transcript_82021:276-1265(-)
MLAESLQARPRYQGLHKICPLAAPDLQEPLDHEVSVLQGAEPDQASATPHGRVNHQIRRLRAPPDHSLHHIRRELVVTVLLEMLTHRMSHSPAMLQRPVLHHTLHNVVPERVGRKRRLVLEDRSHEIFSRGRWAPLNEVLHDTAAVGVSSKVSRRCRGLREEQAQCGGSAVLADAVDDVVAVLVVHQVLEVTLELCYHRDADFVIADLHEPLHHAASMHIHSQVQPLTAQHLHQGPLLVPASPLQHPDQRVLPVLVPRELRCRAQHHVHDPSLARRHGPLHPPPRAVLHHLLQHGRGGVHRLLAAGCGPGSGQRCGNAGLGLNRERSDH